MGVCVYMYISILGALEELALCRAGVAHNAHVDVAPEGDAVPRLLAHAAKEHQQDALLHLVVAKHRRRDALRKLLVHFRVFLHVQNLLRWSRGEVECE